MKVNEDLSILFLLNHQKDSKDGLVPIWVRITVNGKRDGFSNRSSKAYEIGWASMPRLSNIQLFAVRNYY